MSTPSVCPSARTCPRARRRCEERGCEVDHGQTFAYLPCLRKSGPADEERDLEGLLVGKVLAGQTVLAEEVAVVRGVDDDRVVELAEAVQLPHSRPVGLVDGLQAADPRPELRDDLVLGQDVVPGDDGRLVAVVDLVEGGLVEAGRPRVREQAPVPLGRHRTRGPPLAWARVVGPHVRDPQEPRGVLRAELAQVGLRVVGGDVGHVVMGVAHRVAVVLEGGPVVAVGPRRGRVPVVEAGQRAGLVRVAVEHLAHERGPVAGRLQPQPEVLLGAAAVHEGRPPAVGSPVVSHPVVLGVLPGEDLRARWTAHRVRTDEVGDVDARTTDQPAGERHPAHLVVALVVTGDEEDVGPMVGRGQGGRRISVRRTLVACGQQQPARTDQPDSHDEVTVASDHAQRSPPRCAEDSPATG